MTAEGKITERRAREIAEAELRWLESQLRPAGTLPTYDVHIVSMQACRHGWVFHHNARECAEQLGGTLELADSCDDAGRLHRFVLELPEGTVVR